MSKQNPDPDLALWQASLDGVQPLKERPRAPELQPRVEELARLRDDSADVLEEAMSGYIEPEDFNTGDESEFRRDGVSGTTLRKLRRGQFAVQGTIDLHGLTRERAHAALSEFLRTALVRDWRCIKVIHGKGLRSPEGRPVLKSRVEITLQRTDAVLAYCSAPRWAGGHGAALVLLKRRTGI